MTKKKLLAIAVIMVMALSAANIHAQEANNHFAFGLGALIPIDKAGVTVGPGVQLSWYNSKLFTSFMGLGVHAGVYVPMFIDNGTLSGIGIAASVIVGPTFTVFDNGTLAIPITAGLHFDYVSALFTKAQVINLGVGVVGDFEWHFSQKWYAYGRVAFAVNFGAFEFLLMPGLGVGFSF